MAAYRMLFVSSIVGAVIFHILTPPAAALRWYDDAYEDDGWRNLAAPVGESPDAASQLTPGRTTYYFRCQFYVPPDDELRLSRLIFQTTASDGVVVYIHNREIGRSAALPGGDLPYTQRAQTASAAPQLFEDTNLFTECANGWDDSPRELAVELHRVDPSLPEALFDAQLVGETASGHLSVLIPFGATWRCHDEGYVPAEQPAIRMTRIIRPWIGMPDLILPGGSMPVTLDQSTLSRGDWRLFLVNQRMLVPLGEFVAGGTGLADKEFPIPATAVPGLYHLVAVHAAEPAVIAPSAVTLLPPISTDVSLVHITDSHIPYRGRWSWSNTADLRTTIAAISDLNPDAVIHTGDGYNESNARDMAELFQRTLAEFTVPVLYVAGNHELGEWCGDGNSRYIFWDLFGWRGFDPTQPGHQGPRTRDFAVDLGSVTIILLESWINYTAYWMSHYNVTSFLTVQLDWFEAEAAARSGDQYLIAAFHEDFRSQLDRIFNSSSISLALSGHTHAEMEEQRANCLWLKTGATYGNYRPLRWLRIEDGELLEHPLLSRNPLAIETSSLNGNAYQTTVTVRNRESFPLSGLKLWIPLPPDAEYQVAGGELIGQWTAAGRRWVLAEYSLAEREERDIVVATATGPQQISFWLRTEWPLLTPARNLRLTFSCYNRSSPVDVLLFLALEFEGHFYFWPQWSLDPIAVPITLPSGGFLDEEFIDVAWPGDAADGLAATFYAAVVDADTGTLSAPLCTVPFLALDDNGVFGEFIGW